MKIFKDPAFKSNVIRLMIPFLIQEFILSLTSFIGTLMIEPIASVSEYNIGGHDALIGISNVYQIFFIYNVILAAICIVGTLFISQDYGRNRLDLIEDDTYLLIKVMIGLALIFTIISLAIPEQIMNAFTPNNTNAIKYGASYLRLFSITFIFTSITSLYYCVMKNVKLEKVVVYDSALCLLLVVIFTSIFVYGLKLGSFGVGLSIILARVIECVVAVIIENTKGHIHFHLNRFINPNFPLFKKFLHYFLVLFICKVMWCMGVIMCSVVIGKIENIDLIFVNSNCFIPMKSLTTIFSSSAGVAIGILIGRELGADAIERAKDHSTDVIRFSIFIGVIEVIFFALTLPITFFMNYDYLTSHSEAISYLLFVYLIYATQFIPQTFNTILVNGLLSAGGDIKVQTILDSITFWILLTPALLLISFNKDFVTTYPILMFLMISIEECLKTPFFIYRVKRFKWLNNINKIETI